MTNLIEFKYHGKRDIGKYFGFHQPNMMDFGLVVQADVLEDDSLLVSQGHDGFANSVMDKQYKFALKKNKWHLLYMVGKRIKIRYSNFPSLFFFQTSFEKSKFSVKWFFATLIFKIKRFFYEK